MQLPLHAAGVYTGDDRVCCSDYFVSTYAPSVSALLHAQQTFEPLRRADADTLIVAVEHPFEGIALPSTSTEASTIRDLVSPSARVIEAARSEEVIEQIRSAPILHMACHGTQNLNNALQSGFFLEDELLPVSKLMQLELPQAFLAVLSACETAKGDATQPDQAIHLAATMLFAGFKSVVATMWYVPSVSASMPTEHAQRHPAGSCEILRARKSPRASTRPSSGMARARIT
jgi:CHAT domain-containing protein